MNIRFLPRPVADIAELTGPGVYAGFFDGRLIYVGKFLGGKSQPFSGNIAETRWIKHLGTMTLRGDRISFSRRGLRDILQLQLVDELEELRGADHQLLSRDRGLLSTRNRFVFGMENWSSFRELRHETLSRFSFVYVRLVNHDIGRLDTPSIRAVVSEIEGKLVQRLQPRCNAVVENNPIENQCDPDSFARLTVDQYVSFIEPYQFPHAHGLHNAEIRQRMLAHALLENNHTYVQLENTEEPRDPESSSSESLFLDQFSEDQTALDWIRKIRDRFDGEDGVEIHFKKHNPPDMRVRVNTDYRQGRNVFTLEWRSKNREFLCRSLATQNQCQMEGVREIRATRHKEPLETEFRIAPESTNLENMVKLIRQGIAAFASCRI